MNSMVNIFASLVVAAIFSTASFAELKPYCIRIYCDGTINAYKIKNIGDHGRFFSAQYDSHEGKYLINKTTYEELWKFCKPHQIYWTTEREDVPHPKLYGSNADNPETFSSKYVVGKSVKVFTPDPRCRKMERK